MARVGNNNGSHVCLLVNKRGKRVITNGKERRSRTIDDDCAVRTFLVKSSAVFGH